MKRKVVLITGCSSGLGLEMALASASRGFHVVATMRDLKRKGALEEALHARGLEAEILPCDVTQEESMRTCVETVLSKHGSIFGLVNNAGFGLFSPLELAPMDAIRQQMETNFFGLVRMTQLVLPSMRKAREGKIINLSSIMGLVSFPVVGFYNTSKYAVEAFTESLHHEVRPFNIQAILVEPGRFQSDFATRSLQTVQANVEDYKNMVERLNSRTAAQGRKGPPGFHVGKLIADLLEKPRTRLRYRIGLDSHALYFLSRLLPSCILNFIVDVVFHGSIGQFGRKTAS